MPAGTCQRCGAAEVRCKSLCGRCYFARRYEHPEGRRRRGRAAGTLAAVVPRGPWAARAACRDHAALPWTGQSATADMRAVCSSCPVRGECLTEALADPDTAGVWGGTTAAERVALRR